MGCEDKGVRESISLNTLAEIDFLHNMKDESRLSTIRSLKMS